MTSGETIATPVRDLLARMPEWVRTDLASKDAMTRLRAEDTLAAMIEAAFVNDETKRLALDGISRTSGGRK
jgi:hypothetical protein